MKNIISSELNYADAKLSEISKQIPIVQQIFRFICRSAK